jgi:hypothetical protein
MDSLKAELVVKSLVEKRGSVSAAMREAGYSAATAKNPKNLTKTKTFTDLLEKYLPDRHLFKKHTEFLNTPRRIRSYKKGDLVEETEETDPSAVKALDMAYKLKGKYAATTNNNVLVVNISGQTADRYGSAATEPIKTEAQDITPQKDDVNS